MQDSRAALLARFDAGETLLADADLAAEAGQWRDEYSAAYRDWHSAQHAPARFSSYRRLSASDAARALDKLAALASRSFSHSRELQAALARELAKGCLRDGSLHPDEPVCAACRLRLGERLKLRDPRELEAVAEEGIAAFHAALQEAPVGDFLERRETGAALLEWDGTSETLLALLTNDALRVLDEAFRPRRRVARSWGQLQESVRRCRTRAEWHIALLGWLDNGDNLQDDDEVVLTDMD